MLWWSVLMACKAPPTPVPTPPVEPVPTGDTGPVVPTADTAPVLDCSVLPELPTAFDTLSGFTYAEDFDFDLNGNHVSIRSTNGNLVGIQMDTTVSLIAPNVSNNAACTRRLPDGDFVVCDVFANSLVRVAAATGAKVTLLSGMAYPNGADVDSEGFVYVAEQNAGRLRRVDSTTGEATVIATNLNAPNGVVLSPDEQTVYVGSFGSGRVYAVERTGPDTWEQRQLVQAPGGGDFDGIEADACGNIYITEYIDGTVWRIPPSGTGVERVMDLPSSWIPNLRWGSGVGGWDPETLYVADRDQGRVFALPMGIRGAGQ
ncbi:MAG: SMP-30/gluconolactonase/LRE family protein [Myxococcota bacterium]